MDVSSVDSVRAGVDAAEERIGPIDILINNAGLLPAPNPAVEFDDAQWQSVLSVNVTGVMNCTRELARRMIARGGGG